MLRHIRKTAEDVVMRAGGKGSIVGHLISKVHTKALVDGSYLQYSKVARYNGQSFAESRFPNPAVLLSQKYLEGKDHDCRVN